MHYTAKALGEIVDAVTELRFRHIRLVQELSPFAATLKNNRAKEYLQHGVLRRLFILYRCIENMFRIFPADRSEKLNEEEHYDLEINLHCFLINTYGIIENLGLSIAFENNFIPEGTSERSKKNDIGLYNSKFRSLLNTTFKEYLEKSGLLNWFNQYAKEYRDALAHRIPPYIPPSGLNKADQAEMILLNEKLSALSKEGYSEEYSATIDKMVNLGKASPFYLHSFSEGAKPLYLHPQVIADFRTIEELIYKAVANFYFPAPGESKGDTGI